MIVKLLTEHHLEFLSLKGGCKGSSKSTLNAKHASFIKCPYTHQHGISFHNNHLFTKFLVQCFLEYADVLWDNCTQQQCNEIEKKIQFEAGRIVTGTTKLVKIDKLYKELGWLKLSENRDLHKLFLFFKMNHGLSPKSSPITCW